MVEMLCDTDDTNIFECVRGLQKLKTTNILFWWLGCNDTNSKTFMKSNRNYEKKKKDIPPGLSLTVGFLTDWLHLSVHLLKAKQSLATLTKDVPKRHSLAMPTETVVNGNNQEWVMQADLPLTAAIRQSQQTLYVHTGHPTDRQGRPTWHPRPVHGPTDTRWFSPSACSCEPASHTSTPAICSVWPRCWPLMIAPVVTFHALYVAVTANTFLALRLSFVFATQKPLVAAEDQLGVNYCVCLVKCTFTKSYILSVLLK